MPSPLFNCITTYYIVFGYNIFKAMFNLPGYCCASGMFLLARRAGFIAVLRKSGSTTFNSLDRVLDSINSIIAAIANIADPTTE